jgi:DNA modification methylase
LTLFYQEPLIELRQGHVLDTLAALAPESIHVAITSPPYFGLRSYQVEPQIWGGVEGCSHVWGETMMRQAYQPQRDNSGGLVNNRINSRGQQLWTDGTAGTTSQGQYCHACHAWRGSLGNESHPWCERSLQGRDCADQCYLGHLLLVADGIWRVLRTDGTFWLNISDSYNAYNGNRGASQSLSKRADQARNGYAPGYGLTTRQLKPKDLMLIPERVVIALQCRGWTVRSAPPWLKKNAMPSSQDDRPTVSHEEVFLFTKQADYFFDLDAIRVPHVRQWNQRNGGTWAHPKGNGSGPARYDFGASLNHAGAYPLPNPAGRTRRTADWWFESLDTVIADTEAWLAHAKQVRAQGGMLLSPEGEVLGCNVNPQSYAGAHFATFPESLVTPMILASTSEVGCCSTCRSPWRRVTQRTSVQPLDYQGKWLQAEPQAAARRILANTHARRQNGHPHDQHFPSPTSLACFP